MTSTTKQFLQDNAEDAVVVCNFGKYKGKPLAYILWREPSYLVWAADKGLLPSTNAMVQMALQVVAQQQSDKLEELCYDLIIDDDWGR